MRCLSSVIYLAYFGNRIGNGIPQGSDKLLGNAILDRIGTNNARKQDAGYDPHRCKAYANTLSPHNLHDALGKLRRAVPALKSNVRNGSFSA